MPALLEPSSASALLALNGGSSSIKFALFTCTAAPVPLMSGAIAGIGTPGATITIDRDDGGLPSPIAIGATSHQAAIARITAELHTRLAGRPLAAIVHRVVHGGERFDHALRVTPAVLAGLRDATPLAPNHLPDEIALIEAFALAQPDTPQIACFDTAFHRDLPAVSRTLPVPRLPGLRRYGFHGLSYAYLLSELARTAGVSATRGRVVLAHLGNGASLAAVHDGRCIDTTMGLTPTGGLVMSSRAGDLDPGVISYLARTKQLSIDDVDHLLTHEAGLLAISGYSADMRALLDDEAANPRARLAVDIFCYQAKKSIGALMAALGGLETLVFAGGIGEHAPAVRQRICDGLEYAGVVLDSQRNAANAASISAANSPVTVRVIPTNEALMMAREAYAVLTGPASGQEQ